MMKTTRAKKALAVVLACLMLVSVFAVAGLVSADTKTPDANLLTATKTVKDFEDGKTWANSGRSTYEINENADYLNPETGSTKSQHHVKSPGDGNNGGAGIIEQYFRSQFGTGYNGFRLWAKSGDGKDHTIKLGAVVESYLAKPDNGKPAVAANGSAVVRNVTITAEGGWVYFDPLYFDLPDYTTDQMVSFRLMSDEKEFDFYIDDVQMYKGNPYNIGVEEEETTTPSGGEDENRYPAIEGYTVKTILETFDTYTGDENDATIINGTKDDGTAFNANSYGRINGVWNSKTVVWPDSFDGDAIRFWYKSTSGFSFAIKETGKYDDIGNVSIPANPDGGWIVLKYEDFNPKEGTHDPDLTIKEDILKNGKFIGVMPHTNDAIYIDEIHTLAAGEIPPATDPTTSTSAPVEDAKPIYTWSGSKALEAIGSQDWASCTNELDSETFAGLGAIKAVKKDGASWWQLLVCDWNACEQNGDWTSKLNTASGIELWMVGSADTDGESVEFGLSTTDGVNKAATVQLKGTTPVKVSLSFADDFGFTEDNVSKLKQFMIKGPTKSFMVLSDMYDIGELPALSDTPAPTTTPVPTTTPAPTTEKTTTPVATTDLAVTATLDKTSYQAGNTVKMTVSIKGASSTAFSAFNFAVKFDSSVLSVANTDGEVNSAVLGDIIPSGWSTSFITSKAGIVQVLCYDDSNLQNKAIKTDGVLFTIEFQVAAAAANGSYLIDLDISNGDFTKEDGTQATVTLSDATLKVEGTTPVETTTKPAETTTTKAPETTTKAPETTTKAPETTAKPVETTTQAPETTKPEETTPKAEETTKPEETTQPDETTGEPVEDPTTEEPATTDGGSGEQTTGAAGNGGGDIDNPGTGLAAPLCATVMIAAAGAVMAVTKKRK